MTDIFVSTCAFQARSLAEILDLADRAELRSIELSSGLGHEPDLDAVLDWGRRRGFRFLVHNYFPPPADPFVLNLASGISIIRERSIAHCRQAIQLSKQLGASFYSVHAGFAFDVNPKELGTRLRPEAIVPMEEAYFLFVDSVLQLTEYSAEMGIKLAIENHVLAAKNLVGGRNKLLLMVRSEDFLRLAEDVPSPHLGFLIDVGHLAVSARSLSFDPSRFLEAVRHKVIGLHLSDNDAKEDQNLPFDSQAWFVPTLKSFTDTTLVLECGPTSIEHIKATCMTIQEALLSCR
jgi:sugar phosphate isomerase/epimerase